MIDLLRWALQKQERSKDSARKRLQLVLVLDRIGMSAERIDAMKGDIIQAVSRYLDVEDGSIEVDIQRSGDSIILVSNIQVRELIRTFAA